MGCFVSLDRYKDPKSEVREALGPLSTPPLTTNLHINAVSIPEYAEVLIGDDIYRHEFCVETKIHAEHSSYQLTWTLIPKKMVMRRNSKRSEGEKDREL